MKFYIKTYGCQMNERDSNSAAAILCGAGHVPVEHEEDADMILLNTCSVREQAERKAIGKLGFLKRLRKENPHLIFGIMGCMAQSRGAELLQEIAHLDFAIGTGQIHTLPDVLASISDGSEKVYRDEQGDADAPGTDAHRLESEPSAFSAFVSIMRGCNRFCSYCIVPYVRGRERSRHRGAVVEEVRGLVARGIREVTLLGQNVAAYGLDGASPSSVQPEVSPFAELLSQLNEVEGLARIRFTSPHPAYFNERLIDAIAALDKVCKSVHLPLQSGSDRILRAMNRPYDRTHYQAIVSELKRKVPGITFSTDVIVGFPGETASDFQETRDLMNEVGFDLAYIFKYSPRRGTRSAELPDDVPQSVKEERNQLLLKDLEENTMRRNAARVGMEFRVMVEGPSKRNPSRWAGRTDGFQLVVFDPPTCGELIPGTLVSVSITRATAMTLYGTLREP